MSVKAIFKKWKHLWLGLYLSSFSSTTFAHLWLCAFRLAPLQGSTRAKSALSAFPFCYRSLSPSAFDPWLETAGIALSGGHVQSGEPNLIGKGGCQRDCGAVFILQRKKTCFSSSFLSTTTYKYLHINDSLLAVKGEMHLGTESQMTDEDEVSWAQSAGEMWRDSESRFGCLWGSARRTVGKCQRNHDLSWAAGVTLRKISIFSSAFQKTGPNRASNGLLNLQKYIHVSGKSR